MVKYFKKLGLLAFYTFAEYLNAQVTNNAVTWNIPAVVATQLDAAFNIYKPFYDAVKIKKNRTKQQVDDHVVQRGIFETFIEQFANQHIIPNLLITTAIVETLGFNRKQDPGTRPAIESQPHLTLKAKAGRRIQVENRVENDQTRASMHKDCDVVEIRYSVAAAPASGGTTPGSPTTPTPSAATQITKFSKKAKFILQLPDEAAGKIITMEARWVNLTDEAKNGPWSNPAATMVTW